MCINSNNWDVNEKTKDIRLDRMNMNEPKTWREMVWKGQCGGWVKKIVCAVYIYTHFAGDAQYAIMVVFRRQTRLSVGLNVSFAGNHTCFMV